MAMIRFGEATHGWWCGACTRPIRCRSCRAEVFWFSCDCGSSVLFDDLGSPWPVHDCDGHVTRVDLKRPDDHEARGARTLEQRLLDLETVLTVRDLDRHTTASRSADRPDNAHSCRLTRHRP